MYTKYHLDLHDHITVNGTTLYRIVADRAISLDVREV